MWEYQTKVVVTKLRTFTKNHPRMFILWFCIENKQILISHYMTFILEFRLNTLQYLYDVWSLKNCLLNPAITFYSRNNTKSSKKHKINWSKKKVTCFDQSIHYHSKFILDDFSFSWAKVCDLIPQRWPLFLLMRSVFAHFCSVWDWFPLPDILS